MYHEREAIVYKIPIRIYDLARKVHDGEIIFPQDVRSWNVNSNRNFVENLLLGIQPDNLLFQVKEGGQWVVRSGFETIKSVMDFLVEDKEEGRFAQAFPLRYEDIHSTHFDNLKPIWWNSVNEYVIKCTMISPSTPDEIVEDLVNRFKGVEV